MLLVELDLAGADWVVTAYCAQEPRMIDVHKRGVSPHPITAEFMTGVPAELVAREDKLVGHETNPKELEALRKERCPEIFDAATIFLPRSMSCRQAGKKANHGLNYGMEADRFSLENLVPLADARPMVDLYHKAYPNLRKRWYKQLQAGMKRNRMLENCFGRRIQFMGAFGNDLWNKVYAWLPQSTVADITIRGFCNFFADERPWMRAAEPLAQVHDSIVFQYPEGRGWKDMAACLVEVCYSEAMLRPWCEYHGERFQLGVEAKVGRAWGRDTMHEVPLSRDIDEVARNLQRVVEGQAALAA